MSRSVVIDVDTPTATDPRLNLTTRLQNIQHLLDSESDITPDENIPSPLQQEETVHQAMEMIDQLQTWETENK